MKKYTNVKELNKAMAHFDPKAVTYKIIYNGEVSNEGTLDNCTYYNTKRKTFDSDVFTDWEKCAIVDKGTITFYGFNDKIPDIELSKQMGRLFLPH